MIEADTLFADVPGIFTQRSVTGQEHAWFSKGRRTHRYALSRNWNPCRRMLGWLCLNPSIAGAIDNDATVLQIEHYTNAWGFGGFYLTNLYALIATDPKKLVETATEDAIGEHNDRFIVGAAGAVDAIVCAWGGHSMAKARWSQVKPLLEKPLWCLGLTRGGDPLHPCRKSRALVHQTFWG